MLNKLKKGQRELSQELSRTPTLKELSEYVELPETDVKDLMSRAGQPVSLETKIGDGEDTILLDLLSNEIDMPSEQIDDEEFLICTDCKNPLEKCMCVCPYCGERDKCECVLFDAATGG